MNQWPNEMNKIIRVEYNYDLEFPKHPNGLVNNWLWEKESHHRPFTQIFLSYNENCLAVKLKSYDTWLRVLAQQDNEPVWEDNCLEFFFQPYADDERYINIEINPLGFAVIALHIDRNNAENIVHKLKPQLKVRTEIVQDEWWSVSYKIPFEALAEIYSRDDVLKKGSVIRGNFYKCGDETPIPHYGAWSLIRELEPDFHCTEYFGEIHLV